MSAIDCELITQTFLGESEEQMGAMEQALVALEAKPDDEDSIQAIFRIVHTLKGNSVSLDLHDVARFAHVLEDLLDRLRSHTLRVTPDVVTLLLRSVDALRIMVPEEVSGVIGLRPEHQVLLNDLAGGLLGEAGEGPRSGPASPVGSTPLRELGTLRIAIRRLDRMLSLSGEIAIARSRLGQMLESARAAGVQDFLEAHKDMDRLCMDLQEELLAARMVPVGPTFRQQARTVRDVALKHGKRVEVVVEGEDVEVDTTVIEQVRDPLMHLVRNAVDHGIELPEARVARGKSPIGRLVLRAYHETGHVTIELADDGAGLDRRKILARARELGLGELNGSPTDHEVDRLIFEPGFSTAEGVTDLSGRGIGMDVVRRNIEAIRGTITIRSEFGKGTTVVLRLPLTLAIIQGFLVGVGGETYVLPADAVLECVDLPAAKDNSPLATGIVTLRNEALPYVRLRDAFGLGGEPSLRGAIVIVRHGEGRAGIAVDSLCGEAQVVIKPLGRPFAAVPGLAGSTILGNGRVALILDVAALIESAILDAKTPLCRSSPAEAGAGRSHAVGDPGTRKVIAGIPAQENAALLGSKKC